MKSAKLFLILTSLAVLLLSMTQINRSTEDAKTSVNQKQTMQDYNKEWKEIEELEKKGLIKSALEKVEALYVRALEDSNAPQIIKVILHREKFGSQLEEYGFENSLRTLKEEAAKLDGSAKALVHFLQGRLLSNYLQQNYWKFSNRTNTPAFKPEDLETWSISHFVDEINENYEQALVEESLKSLDIKDYEVLTLNEKNTDALRPTLYDFILHQILDYYVSPNSYLTEPVYKFYLEDEEAFASAEEFAAHTFETRDSSSYLYKSVLLFQEGIRNRLTKGDTAALYDIDEKRLNFVWQNSTLNDKGKRYITALEKLAGIHKSNKNVLPHVLLAQAKLYQNSTSYLGDEKNNLQKAHGILDQIIRNYPKSIILATAKNNKSRIESKSLALNIEKVHSKNENLLGLVSYKNIGEMHCRLYKLERGEEYELRKRRKNILPAVKSKEVLKEWKQALPAFDDFHAHQTEVKIDALPFGDYVLLISDGTDFIEERNIVSANFFVVSNLSYVTTPNHPNHHMVVMDRLNGHPVADAKVELYKQNYNQVTRKQVLKKQLEVRTDKDGFVKTKLEKRDSYMPKVTIGEDVLFVQDWLYKSREHTPRDRHTVNIFLDRAIYRPGQTVYFKAIAHNIDGATQLPSLLPNTTLDILLRDANHQEVEKLSLTTNEYGSIHGSFTAPIGGLLGNMSIQIPGYGGTSFSIEEYKRPKFEAKFLPIEAEYALNESVLISGKAIGFAGNTIDGAKVAYRVERGVEYPYWRYSYYRSWRPQNPVRIKTGETETKTDGSFDIAFDLLPDPATKQKDKPVFVYIVYADITDISGETKSVQARIKASEIALSLNASVLSPISRDSFKSVNISTTNLNGKFQSAEVDMTIVSLKSEDRLFRNRLWQFPDTVSMTRAAFEADFPSYRYGKKKTMAELPEVNVLYQQKVNTTEKGEVNVEGLKLDAGYYRISVKATDKNGNEVSKEITFEVRDDSQNIAAIPTALTVVKDKGQYQPGENAEVEICSAQSDAMALFTVMRRNKKLSEKWLPIHNTAVENIGISKEDLGNVHIHTFTLIDGRVHQNSLIIDVPWTEKDLKISYSSFRDKLLPGQDEEWTIKIEGAKKEAVAAEVLAGMYDASLDQFRANNWRASYFPTLSAYNQIGIGKSFSLSNAYSLSSIRQVYDEESQKRYRHFNMFGFNYHGGGRQWNMVEKVMTAPGTFEKVRKKVLKSPAASRSEGVVMDEITIVNDNASNQANYTDGVQVEGGLRLDDDLDIKSPTTNTAPAVRKNLNETVFFFPNLHTDKDGNVLIKFKMNEALTKWKFMAFAHTKDLATAISTKEVVTQKELMVQPNAPRFFREGDKIRYSAKVSNLAEKNMKGEARLELFDAITMEVIDADYGNSKSKKKFEIAPGESQALFWDLDIPMDKLGTVLHRVIAKAGKYSDGEESALPVLTNRKLVTETMPLPVRAGQSKEFVFKTMRDNTSTTLTNYKYTLEFTSNPAWYAVQSLPYLMQYPYDCTEQIFNKLYANSLASHVANKTPKIKQIFESWKGTDAMKSNLSKNQELKSALLEETPWVLDAQSEEQQRRNVGLLFDLNKMSNEKAQYLKMLKERQLSNGGFAWFPGGRDNWYITQYLVEGIGHLQTLGVDLNDPEMNQVLQNAVRYIDDRLVEDYNRRLKYDKSPGLTGMVIHYLYARSFFTQYAFSNRTEKVVKHYQEKAKSQWLDQGLYYQGLLALATHRFDMNTVAGEITASLKERALSHEELGKYWKYTRGYYWHEMPIETHSVMIEVFEKVAQDAEMVDELRLWLLKNKQTNDWETTKATSAAIYALLLSGDDWLQETKQVEIIYPNKVLNADLAKSQATAETGTGYFKHTWNEVNPNLASVKISNPNTVPAWGAAYWQYFEDLDKITTFEDTPLKLNKKVFLEKQGDRGATMDEVKESTSLKMGDKLTVRIELRVDRDMEFIHMKDMRASGFEPINVFSQYKWQGGLGYFESTKDASTNFFFDSLPKGTYVFEYPLRVVHEGDFSNGVTTIQSMYAPEFTSHSEGVRVRVGE